MKIKICLNDLKYRYDVYQIFNIFFPQNELEFINEEWDYNINLCEGKISLVHKGNIKEFAINKENAFKEEIKKILYKFLQDITEISHPWGTLVGIRPAKIANRLMEENLNDNEIVEFYDEHYLTSKEKALLCLEVAKREKIFINSYSRTVSVYLGMPFCPTRCVYCSFASNSITGKEILVKKYLEALTLEIESTAEYIKTHNLNIESVYFGGGTPTAVNNEQFDNLLSLVHRHFTSFAGLKEFTVEAGRPDSITYEKLISMKKYGVTRISINPQTMNDKTLKRIGRAHSVEDVKEKFHMARECGFTNINMDLIIGLPGERIEEISKTCNEILKLKPESLTVHGMSIKRASKMYELKINEQVENNFDINELKAMYELTRKTAEELEMKPYYLYRQKNMIGNMENIGYAKESYECLYNIQIMEETQTIIALGADAVTKVVFKDENRIERTANLKDVQEYVNRIDEMISNKINLLDTHYK